MTVCTYVMQLGYKISWSEALVWWCIAFQMSRFDDL